VLGVSATQSGNLLTPLLIGVVIASIIGGQTISRTGEYKALGVVGSVLVAAGMILFARMDAATTRLYVAAAMVVAGFGMGLLQPVYTLAVQNVAPRERMGAATSSTIFFRSNRQYRGRRGVRIADADAVSQRVHADDPVGGAGDRPGPTSRESAAADAGPPAARSRIRPRAGGAALLQRLLDGVKAALLHGLQEIFLWSAVIMTASILLHLMLKREPLRVRTPADVVESRRRTRPLEPLHMCSVEVNTSL